MTETTVHPHEELLNRIRMTSGLYAADLNAMTDDMLNFQSSKSRSAYDFTSEVISVNRIAAAGARGEAVNAPDPSAGWHKAPESFKSKDAAIADFTSSVEELLSAMETAKQGDLDRIVESPLGPIPVLRLVNIVPMHLMYHSGQLNLIQTLHGDDQIHWR